MFTNLILSSFIAFSPIQAPASVPINNPIGTSTVVLLANNFALIYQDLFVTTMPYFNLITTNYVQSRNGTVNKGSMTIARPFDEQNPLTEWSGKNNLWNLCYFSEIVGCDLLPVITLNYFDHSGISGYAYTLAISGLEMFCIYNNIKKIPTTINTYMPIFTITF